MFLPYGRQCIDDSDIDAVVEVLRSDFLTTGPQIPLFEEALSGATGAQEVVACSNGTTALHLALITLGVGPGDAVIVPTVTFLATANAVRYVGADVIFADVDPQTGLMSAEHAKEALTRCGDLTPKVMMPVHLGGHLCDLKALRAVCDSHGMYMVADSCHALGGSYDGFPVGACEYEDMATFSFHPVKTIAAGEGGAITTRSKQWADRMRVLRSHGMNSTPDKGMWAYEMQELGYNYRITDMQCALGISQLKRLDDFIRRRKEIAALYDDLFAGVKEVEVPSSDVTSGSGWHLYALRIDFEALGLMRNDFMQALRDQNIGSQVHYIPVHSQPYYHGLYGSLELSGADQYYKRTLSIPFYPTMRDEDVRAVANAIKEILS